MKADAPRERFEGVELLRFALALGVVIFHYYFWAPHKGLIGYAAPPSSANSLVYLLFGVEAFFAVSGFVIVLSTANRKPVEFLIARAARLGPTLLVASSLTLVLYVLLDVEPRVTGAGLEYILSVLFVPLARLGTGLDPSLWSLTFEIRFYLLIFICMWLFDVRRRALAIGIVLLTTDLARTLFPIMTGHAIPTHLDYFKDYAPFFVIGMLFYDRRAKGRVGPVWIGAMVAAIALSAVRATRLLTDMYDLSLHLGHVHLWQGTLVALAIVLLMAGSTLRVHQPGLARVFRASGRASYPLYVVHQLCGYWILNYSAQRLHVDFDLRPLVVLAMIGLSLAYGNWLEPALIRLYKRVLNEACELMASLGGRTTFRAPGRREIADSPS